MQKMVRRTSIAVALVAAAFAASGCKSKKPAAKADPTASAAPAATPKSVKEQVERAVKGYMNAPSCLDRLNFVVNAAKNGPFILDHYQSVGCNVRFLSMDASDCDKPKNDGCVVKVLMDLPAGPPGQTKQEEHSYCVVLTPTPKVDWRCSKGFNPVPLAQFKAAHDDARPAKFRFYAELSDVYLDEYKGTQDKIFSVRLRDADGGTIHGYIEKDTPIGKLFSNVLKDGKPHRVALEIGYSRRNQDPEAATILTLYALSWREFPAEFE
jgi:hypothetical protein